VEQAEVEQVQKHLQQQHQELLTQVAEVEVVELLEQVADQAEPAVQASSS